MASKDVDREVIDLTSSPEQSFKEAVEEALEETQEGGLSSQESELVTVFLPDDIRFSDDENETPASASHEEDPVCKYVGSNCQFAKTCIILSPCLVDPPGEATTLLKEHGIMGVTMSIDEWLGNYGKLSGAIQHRGMPGKTIVLVDCLEHADEMKRTLKTLDGNRSKDMPERQEWITAYDWRVLRYISMLEDESKTKKYYDGFASPWTRWFCGLV